MKRKKFPKKAQSRVSLSSWDGRPKWPLLPTLYNTKEAVELSQRAFEAHKRSIAKSGLGSCKNNENSEIVQNMILSAAEEYLRRLAFQELPSPEVYRERAVSIAKASAKLIEEINKEPKENFWFIADAFEKETHISLWPRGGMAEVQSLNNLLTSLFALCNEAKADIRTSPGIKERLELRNLIWRVCRLWSYISGRRFPKSLQINIEPGKDPEFTSAAAYYLHEMVRVFDAQVTAVQIRTILKSLPPAALSVQT